MAGEAVVFKGAVWYLLLVLLEYDWTFSIVEHGRNFTPAVFFGFLYDEEFSKDVLFKLSTHSRAQLLRDCSVQMNLTTRGGWTGESIAKALSTDESYVGPLRWLLKSKTGEELWQQLSQVYEQVRCHGKNVNTLLRSPPFYKLWREVLMNIPVASDLRSEQLVKLVKNWPEVSSRNIITWWQKIIFATQDNLMNPLPYIPPYGKDFRATQLFKTPAKKELAEKPVLKMSLKDGVPNKYSRVWPLLDEEEFCLERAILNRQRVRPKAEGIKATLSRASKWGKKKFSNSPAASTLKRNQLIRGSPLENISTDRVKRVRVRDGPLPVKKPKQPATIARRLTRRRFKPTQQLLMLDTFFAAPHIFLLRLILEC